MYSVIIQNKKSAEAFSKFHPVFMDAINSDRIGLCRWHESGTTIDTALPELAELTNDKEQWKAIIVRYEDEQPMAQFESTDQNPYDFLINADKDDSVRESKVPLIRLTQMLGGVPEPEIRFEPVIVQDEIGFQRTVYNPSFNEDGKKERERLQRKYHFNGKLPVSVIVLTVRVKNKIGENIDNVWNVKNESGSSDFWSRNRYPANCRFAVYYYTDEGSVKKNADDFGFWVSVMMLATNDIDSSTMQGYRLYNVAVKINKSVMKDSFVAMNVRLRKSRLFLEQEIRKDIEGRISIDPELPDYKWNSVVAVPMPAKDECTVKKGRYRLFSRGIRMDIGAWNKQKKDTEAKLEKAVRMAERTLDQVADNTREFSVFSEEEVIALDRYQTEDMERETNEIYSDIVDIQNRMPSKEIVSSDEVVKASDEVKKYLGKRVMLSSALVCLGIVFGLILLSHVPAVVDLIAGQKDNILSIIAVCAGMMLFVFLCALVAVIIQKAALNSRIKKYNAYIDGAFAKMTENASDYSLYMSKIYSHTRGKSYMKLSDRKKHKAENMHYLKFRHIKAINIMLAKLRTWATAFYLDVDSELKDISWKENLSDVKVDVGVSPSRNTMYTFETGKCYPVAVNQSGFTIDAPFGFIERIDIVREELYDDDGNH